MPFYIPVTPELITSILNNPEIMTKAAESKAKYEKYKVSAGSLNIQTRQAPDYEKDTQKPFPRLNNDFRGDIVDTKTGYMVSIPISYTLNAPLDANEIQIKETEKKQEVINAFNLRNTMPDLDVESVRMTSICGESYRKLKIGTAERPGVELAENLKPWEVVYLTEKNNDDKPVGALHYYTVVDTITGEEVSYAEFYDDTFIYYFVKSKNAEAWSWDFDSFAQDAAEETGTQSPRPENVSRDIKPIRPHLFDDIPIIKFKNNEEELGDVDKVEALIDNYDELLSDQSGELMTFAHAYLGLFGFTATEAQLKLMKQTGAFQFPTKEGRAEFITKNIADSAYMNQLRNLENNIFRFAKHINFSSSEFTGNLTKIAIKFKIYNLEMKSKTLELKLARSLRRQYKLLSGVWFKKGIDINYLMVDFVFTRNIPTNILEEAETQQKLLGVVSEETRLSLASFIPDANAEIKKMEEEETKNQEENAYDTTTDQVIPQETRVDNVTDDDDTGV